MLSVIKYKMKIRKDPLSASKLAQTILKTNPAIDRVTGEKLDVADKLNLKKSKMTEHQRKQFLNKFESRRKKRSALYDRLKPKLEPSTRSVIEKYKVEAKKAKGAIAPLNLVKASSFQKAKQQQQQGKLMSQPSVEFGNNEDNLVTSCEETETQDLSRRSSLRSSILEVTRSGTPEVSDYTENPLGGINGVDEKPEVVVTKPGKPEQNVESGDGKMSAYMHLIPAPTPTRFVGKMAKVREDKKKMETKPSSRRSSIFPVKETIEESAEAAETKAKALASSGNVQLYVFESRFVFARHFYAFNIL